jgi:hypothetical protein
MANTQTALRDGKYIASQAVYYVKDGKILMNIKGCFYKTTGNFMFGTVFSHPLTPGQSKSFDAAYAAAKNW